MIHDQKLLQTKIDTLYNVLHELNQFPDKFAQAKKDIQVEIDELEKQLFEQIGAKIMKEHKFTCYRCKKEIIHKDIFTTGYGLDNNDNKHCYLCCGELDKESMRKNGQIILYLSQSKGTWKVSNWPSSLKFKPIGLKTGRHNWGLTRYDFWFVFEGFYWHGYRIGDNTEICHCKKTKEKVN